MGSSVDAQNMDLGKKVTVVFVLGGPGSGKGTQCANIVEHFGYTHLSAGDLLRAEIKSGSENGTMIQSMIKEGKIVPSEITVELLQRAMHESGNDKFLIDGFPRNEENRTTFESVTGIVPEFILFFDCPEEEMEKRLLSRNQGREDDNIETIRKRFKVYMESSLPVIEYYDSKGKVRKGKAAYIRPPYPALAGASFLESFGLMLQNQLRLYLRMSKLYSVRQQRRLLPNLSNLRKTP